MFYRRDGILGHQVFCAMLFTDSSTGRFQRKPYSTLVKNLTKKSPKQENSTYLRKAFCRTKNEGRKPEKNSGLRRLEFLPRKPRLKMQFKKSTSGKYNFPSKVINVQ
jgi:hypothetical protein